MDSSLLMFYLLLVTFQSFTTNKELNQSNSTEKPKTSETTPPRSSTKKYTSIPLVQHFCQLINRTKHLELQALTIDNRQLYLMHNDNLYFIPLSNLNTKDNVLYMYDLSTKNKIYPFKWFEVVNTDQLLSSDKNAAKHHLKNGPGNLANWQLFPVDSNHVVPPAKYDLLMNYVFKGKNDTVYDELLIDKLTGRALYDSTDNNTVGDPTIDYRLQARHLPFRAITDGQDSTRGYLFHYDQTDEEAKKRNRPKRVLIDVLYRKPSAPGAIDFINFPLNDNRQQKTGAYMRVESDAQRGGFSLFKHSPTTVKDNKNDDYFQHLPFGFIGPNSEVYLFSESAQRVYRIDYFNLELDTTLPRLTTIIDKHWAEFFICSPKQNIKSGKDLSPLLTQEEYLVQASDWAKRYDVIEEKPLWTVKFVGALVGIGLLIAVILCLAMLRIRKLRLDELREQSNALKLLSINSYSYQTDTTISNTLNGTDSNNQTVANVANLNYKGKSRKSKSKSNKTQTNKN